MVFLLIPGLARGDDSVQLIQYEEFPSEGSDFSGITHIPESERYLVIDDSCKVIEIDTAGDELTILRNVKLKGLDDCEAIAFMEAKGERHYKVAVTEERHGNLVVFEIPEKAEEIKIKETAESYFVDDVTTFFRRNSGLEALCKVDSENGIDLFYVGKEEKPKKVYEVRLEDNEIQVREPWDAEEKFPKNGDIAAMDFFEGALWILDERLSRVYEVKPENGEITGMWQLPKLGGFKRYEGISVTRRDGGTIQIVVVAEENSIFVFQVKKIS